MPLRGPLPLPIDIVAAAAGADGKVFLRDFLAEAPGLRAGPDFPEGLVPHVADEIVGEVAAETDLAVRLDLSEVPRDRAPVVAECLAKSVKYSGTLSAGTSGTKETQGRPSAESAYRRRRRLFKSLTRSVICFVFVPSAPPGQENLNPFQEDAVTPKVSCMTFSYSAPTSSGMNHRNPMLIVSSASGRSASMAGAISPMFSSVTGRIAICIGRTRPSSRRHRATAAAPAARLSKVPLWPRLPGGTA